MTKQNRSVAKRPIGILGGIFDPVHTGHLATACLARDYFKLDKVYLIPSGIPPHKAATVVASPKERLTMLRRATRTVPGLFVWDEEIRRPGISYTVDTIALINKKHPGRPIYFIIGSDNLSEVSTWHEFEKIIAGVTLCVAHRPPATLTVPRVLAKAKIRTFPSAELPVSSTLVRSYLALGYSCDFLLPPSVAAYIKQHGLYKKKKS